MMTKHEKMTLKATGVVGFMGILITLTGYYNGAEARKSLDKSLMTTQTQALQELNEQLDKAKAIKTKIPIGQKDFECLALNAFNEAGNYKDGNTTRADMFFISSTVLNRAHEWGDSICATVYSKKGGVAQYSWTIMPSCGGQKQYRCFPKNIKEAQTMNVEKWKRATEISQSLLSGGIKPIQNIMWYNNPKASENDFHITKFRNNEFSVYTSIGGYLTDGTKAQHAYYYESKNTNKEALLMVDSKMKGNAP